MWVAVSWGRQGSDKIIYRLRIRLIPQYNRANKQRSNDYNPILIPKLSVLITKPYYLVSWKTPEELCKDQKQRIPKRKNPKTSVFK